MSPPSKTPFLHTYHGALQGVRVLERRLDNAKCMSPPSKTPFLHTYHGALQGVRVLERRLDNAKCTFPTSKTPFLHTKHGALQGVQVLEHRPGNTKCMSPPSKTPFFFFFTKKNADSLKLILLERTPRIMTNPLQSGHNKGWQRLQWVIHSSYIPLSMTGDVWYNGRFFISFTKMLPTADNSV